MGAANDGKLVSELEAKLAYHKDQLARYRQALAALRGKPRKERRTSLHRGSIPYLVATILMEHGPLTSIELLGELEKQGREISPRELSTSLGRYLREGRVFRISGDGKYELVDVPPLYGAAM